MSQYDNTNRFALFRNQNKDTDKHPDMTGTLNVDGVEYFIDGWSNTSKDGKKYLSGKIKRKDKQPDSAPAASPAPNDDIDSDIPF